MSNDMTLEQAFAELSQMAEYYFVEESNTQVRNITKEIALEINDEYDHFFEYILKYVIGHTVGSPAFFSNYLNPPWEPLSDRWNKTKAKSQPERFNAETDRFYDGLSNGATLSPNLSIRRNQKGFDEGINRGNGRKQRARGKIKVPSFGSYIQSLTGQGNTERFFGAVTIQYEFKEPRVGHVITAKMGVKKENGEDFRNQVLRLYTKARGTSGSAKNSSQMRMIGNVEAFGVLAKVQATEFYIIDYILKVVDPSHEKQWVKINSRKGWFGRGNRPIRGVITPLIKRYINKSLPEIMNGYK